MTHQSEQALEENLIKQLVSLGHKQVVIPDEASLLTNLQTQLERHNRMKFSTGEFLKVLLRMTSPPMI